MSKQQTFGLVTLGAKGRVVLPDALRRLLDLHAGDHLLIERTERGSIELVPAAVVPRDQRWFSHPEMQARVAEAEAAIAAGDTIEVGSIDEAEAYLDRLKRRGNGPAAADIPVAVPAGAARPTRDKVRSARKGKTR